MGKFKKKTNTSQEIPTAALPDIIFMLLFFFMVTTVMRETDLLIENKVPLASQLQKLEKKSLVSYIYIGKPKVENISRYGKEPKIQLNDRLVEPDAIANFVEQERAKLSEAEKDQITISLKVDQECKMGIVNDVKLKLRDVNARKINYSNKVKATE